MAAAILSCSNTGSTVAAKGRHSSGSDHLNLQSPRLTITVHSSHTDMRRHGNGRRHDTRRVTARPAQSRDIARRPPALARHAAVPTLGTDGMGAVATPAQGGGSARRSAGAASRRAKTGSAPPLFEFLSILSNRAVFLFPRFLLYYNLCRMRRLCKIRCAKSLFFNIISTRKLSIMSYVSFLGYRYSYFCGYRNNKPELLEVGV